MRKFPNYPFTTKHPSTGNAQAITICVHKEFDVQDNPKNSRCMDGWRYIPIELIDLPGLIKGAWQGKGLGNQFLTVAAQSDALIHVVDVSGGIDVTGKVTEQGTGDPVADVGDIEEDILAYLKLLEGNRDKISRSINAGVDIIMAITDVLRGVEATRRTCKNGAKKNSMMGGQIRRI